MLMEKEKEKKKKKKKIESHVECMQQSLWSVFSKLIVKFGNLIYS